MPAASKERKMKMIQIVSKSSKSAHVEFCFEKEEGRFKGKALETLFYPEKDDKEVLLTGLGEKVKLGGSQTEDNICRVRIKEAAAKAVKEMRSHEIFEFSMDISSIAENYGIESLRDVVEGALLADYEQIKYPAAECTSTVIELTGVEDSQIDKANEILNECGPVIEGVRFARDMVNMPGNKLRPEDFAGEVLELVKDTDISAEVFHLEDLREMKMEALLGVGESSEFPPCLVVLRYMADPESEEVTGLVGKGVTCDTGGYCLKPAASMGGIRGDMAGGAAVAGAIYALAKNHVKTNAVALIPMCENRISDGSLLPGDVIGSYAGKTIEIANTDAEGRLILADAVSYAVKQEKVTRILDIATLTGAVVGMLGFTVGGVISDNQEWFDKFREAYQISGERYWRLPVYPEHEKMIKSKVADIKNMGESCCGTITAGLFIRSFAEGRPWLHLDIAGTAWVEPPVFEFQSAGATGAGVTTIYQLCK